MDLKNNRGVTLADISISIMIIFLFSSLITGLVYNYSTSIKAVNRKAEATQHAITVIEELKQIEYNNILSALANNGIKYNENEKYYTLGLDELNEIPENKSIDHQILEKDGYNIVIKLQKYEETEGNSDKEKDIIIIATVTVKYNVGRQEQKVQLTTLLVKEIS